MPRARVNIPGDRGIRPGIRKYSPDQPRVPAGSPDGGQWTSDGGGGPAELGDLGREMDADLAAARQAMRDSERLGPPGRSAEEQAAINRLEADPNFSHRESIPVERKVGQTILEGQLTDAHLPAEHTEFINSVRIHEDDWIPASDPSGDLTNAAGLYDPVTRDIHIAINAPNGNIQVIGGKTLLHEIGHHVHLAKMTSEGAQRWAEYSQKGTAARISAYARTNTGEHFADAYRAYARGGSYRRTLKALEPTAYNFMREVFRPSGSKLLLPKGRTAYIPGGWQTRYRGEP